MASFIMAMTINPAAKKAHKDLAKQINDSLDVFAEHKVKLKNLYATLGRYDILTEFDVPEQNTAFKIASAIATRGILDTETWPVIPYDEFSGFL